MITTITGECSRKCPVRGSSTGLTRAAIKCPPVHLQEANKLKLLGEKKGKVSQPRRGGFFNQILPINFNNQM